MGATWQLQEAKNRLSELVDRAVQSGPQTITRRGKPTVVVLSIESYRKGMRDRPDIVDFFQASPLRGIELNLDRSQDLPREVDL